MGHHWSRHALINRMRVPTALIPVSIRIVHSTKKADRLRKTNREYSMMEKNFQRVVLEGSSYEVGRRQGEILKNQSPGAAKWFASAETKPERLGFDSFEDLQAFYEEHCPGITDEVQGFADSLGAEPEKLQIYCPPIYQPGSCSQFAVMSSLTSDKHVLVGRSYEYHHEMNDFRLCTARISGKVKHIGFTEFLLARDDGMNDHGLCVTFAGGGTFKREPTRRGFAFFLVIRALLDNCSTVAEAVRHLERTPVSGYWSFLITDKDDNAALAQFFDGEHAIKRIGPDSSEQCLFSTNHYVLPDLVKYQKYAGDWILKNSKRRFELIGTRLSQASPNVSTETIRDLLSKEIYDGVCGHYYSDYFGTLFSVIYDLTDLKAHVCFGAPTHNHWQEPFSLDDPVGLNHHSAVLPDKSIKMDELWQN
jgi:predicted choloylglycine hydrolase